MPPSASCAELRADDQNQKQADHHRGGNQRRQGFDDALAGRQIGDKRTVEIPFNEAYGERNDDMMMEFPKTDFPPDVVPAPGLELQMSDQAGNIFPVVITEVKEESVILDANHPLAGKDLVFEIELVSIA